MSVRGLPEATQELERAIGAVLVPQVRPGTPTPDDAYLARFPPAAVIAFRGDARAGRAEELLAALRERCERLSGRRPIAMADLEEGAGLHFAGATHLPPALALAAADEGDRARGEPERGEARIADLAALTAREARGLGVELVLAPVADLCARLDNPIVATRGLGARADDVARRAAAWVRGLRAGGAGACLKHFPGHGATREDSHVELARVERPLAALWREDLAPYRNASQADCVMVGHLDAPQLSGEPGLPATLSRAVVQGVLRDALGFRGVVLTDALDMGAVARAPRRHARALEAGCEGLLMPAGPGAAAEELLAAARERAPQGTRCVHRLERAARAMLELAARLTSLPSAPPEDGDELALEAACAALVASREPWPWRPGAPCRVELVQDVARPDDAPPDDLRLPRALSLVAQGVPADPDGPVALAVGCEVRAWRGRAGLDDGDAERLAARLAEMRAAARPHAVVWLGAPQALPGGLWADPRTAVLLAHAPTPPMARAAARFLRGTCDAPGLVPPGCRAREDG